MSDSATRGVLVGAIGLAALVALWHTSPLLLWHLRFADELATDGHVERLHAELRDEFPGPREGWTELALDDLGAHIPLLSGAGSQCAACATLCVLPLDDGGTFAVFDEPPPEGYGDILDRFAPDVDDLSVLRSVDRNWKTIDALADRVRHMGRLPTTFRFRNSSSRGVVSAFQFEQTRRWVVYAYATEGRAARVVGVSGTSEERFARILGGLRVDAAVREVVDAGCR